MDKNGTSLTKQEEISIILKTNDNLAIARVLKKMAQRVEEQGIETFKLRRLMDRGNQVGFSNVTYEEN